MRTAIILIAVLSFSDLAFSDTIYVPDDYAKIQEAIDASVNGDTIIIRSGTYIENIDFIGKTITVKSEQGAGVTVIDGNQTGTVVTCQNGEDENSVLDGFTITNGYANYGGGMRNINSSPTVTNCTFEENSAYWTGGGMANRGNSSPTVNDCTFDTNTASLHGGGMSNKDSNPSIINCIFAGNWASEKGGGIALSYSSATVTYCTFNANSAYGGGGVHNDSYCSLTIDNCTFDANAATWGGGIINSDNTSASVTDCIFTGNTAQYGGGVVSDHHFNATFTECTFSGNQAIQYGGGISFRYSSSSTSVTDCTFTGNTAQYGGGVNFWVQSSASVTDCTFTENQATYYGGGMGNWSSEASVKNCTFEANSAAYGGGMLNDHNSSTSITNCTFSGNQATNYGGGMENYDNSSATITNSLFTGNSAGDLGGGMLNNISNPTVTNCTFFENSATNNGGGMGNIDYSNGTVVINCILRNDTPDEIYDDSTSASTVTYSCIQGGWPGIGNIDSNPLFVDPANNDFHLTFDSPCRDSGDNSAITELYDFEGDPRIAYGTVDIGADEFYTHLYVTGNKTPGGAIQGKMVGLPDTNPVGLFIGSGILPSPMNTMWGEYWLQAPWILFGPLGSIPSNGVMALPTTLPPGMTVPVDIPMQALIGLNADSLTNLCVLEVR